MKMCNSAKHTEFSTLLSQQLISEHGISRLWNDLNARYKTSTSVSETEIFGSKEMKSMFLYAAGENLTEITASLAKFNIDLSTLNSVLLTLETVCIPPLLLLYERYKLFTSKQKHSQNAPSFLRDLLDRADVCVLGDLKEKIILQCLLDGLSCERLKQHLKSTCDLDTAKALKICNQYSKRAKPSYIEHKTDAESLRDCNRHPEIEQVEDWSEELCASGNKPAVNLKYDVVCIRGLASGKPSQVCFTTQCGSVPKLKENSFQSSLKLGTKLPTASQENRAGLILTNEGCALKSDEETQQHPEITDSFKLSDANQHKELLCKECGEAFKCLSLLKRHMVKHSQDKPFSCSICGHRLKRKAEVKVHMKKHNNQRDFKCTICGFAFMRGDHLKAHMRTHSGEKPYSCDICFKSFSYLTSLSVHRNSHSSHSVKKIYKYTCETCGKSFQQRTPFTNHLRIHSGEKPFSCSECDKCFSSKALLRQHARVHSGDLPFICDICGKRFRHNQNLHIHKKAHTGKRSYVCDLCGAAYLYVKNLKQHKRGVHGVYRQTKETH